MRKIFDKETLAAISTLFGFTLIVPALFLFRSKDEFVRFWAGQALVFFTLVFVVDWLVLLVRIISFLPSLIFILTLIVWLIMVYKSWLRVTWEMPFIGRLTRRVFKLRRSGI